MPLRYRDGRQRAMAIWAELATPCPASRCERGLRQADQTHNWGEQSATTGGRIMPQDAVALRAILNLAPVIPVIVLDDLGAAKPLAEALVAGGLPVLEVTLRTPNALKIMAEMAKVPGAIVGAGTL